MPSVAPPLPDRVYVALHGERGEGASILGIFEDEDDAIAACLSVERCFAGAWTVDESAPPRLLWRNGCDVVEVQEHEIVPRPRDKRP